MDLINSLLEVLKKKESNETTPEGYCPNCWGREEYGGHFYEAVKNNNVDVDVKNPRMGWIRDYANKHLTPIALVTEGDHQICQKCKLTYKAKDHN